MTCGYLISPQAKVHKSPSARHANPQRRRHGLRTEAKSLTWRCVAGPSGCIARIQMVRVLRNSCTKALPLNGTGERKPIEIFRSKSQVQGSRFSPDSSFVSYVSNETKRNEVYVRPFDPAAGANAAPAKGPWQ